jgi:hypothetical protein
MKLAMVVCLVGAAAGCKSAARERDAYPVGLLVGGVCTYDAPASVASIEAERKYARLVGVGEVVETCGDSKTTYDVLVPTAMEIAGPPAVKVGEADAAKRTFAPHLLAGKRPLTGYGSSNARPTWLLDADCAGIATLEEPLGAQDTGGPEIDRRMVAIKAGTCTLEVELLGVRGKRAITIE